MLLEPPNMVRLGQHCILDLSRGSWDFSMEREYVFFFSMFVFPQDSPPVRGKHIDKSKFETAWIVVGWGETLFLLVKKLFPVQF
jgi:hypothetical protein